MNRSGIWPVVVAFAAFAAAVMGWRVYHAKAPDRPIRASARRPLPPVPTPDASRAREALFAELHPILLKNCAIKRFGEANDGGYLLCANLLKGVRFFGEGERTSSVTLTLKTGKVRFIESIHLDKGPDVKVRFA